MEIQTKVANLHINGKKTGPKIKLGKTVVMKWDVNLGMKIQLEGRDIEEVEKFVYLGSTVTTTDGVIGDLSARLGETPAFFCYLKNIQRSIQLRINNKLRVLNPVYWLFYFMVAKRGE